MTPRIPILCGEALRARFRAIWALCDFAIGKPGPGSISEALAMRLPVIVEKNAWTLAHERFNADWVREQEVGIVVGSFSKIADAVRELLAPARYAHLRERAAATRETPCWRYEIPALLDGILWDHSPQLAA